MDDNLIKETPGEKLSKWEQNQSKNHPLLSQLVSNIIAGIVAGCIAGFMVSYWASNNIPPNTQSKITSTVNSSVKKVQIENLGYMPANSIYEIATGPGAVPDLSIDVGQEYVMLEDTADEHIKLAIIKGLPKSGKIEIVSSGSGSISIRKK